MSFGIWELIIVLVIVAVIFGTTKLKTLGKDVGEGVVAPSLVLVRPSVLMCMANFGVFASTNARLGPQ